MNHSLSTLQGIIPPLVTPLHHGRLDELGLEKLIEYVLCGEVSGLFILGTTGEGPSLSRTLKRRLVVETLGIVAGRVPVLVGVSDPSLDEALEMTHFAAEHGAAAVVSTGPFYFPISQQAARRWYEQLANASPLPVMLYNFPLLAKLNLEPNTVGALMQHPQIVGIKDSSGNLDYFRQLCELSAQRNDWRVFIGPEEKLCDAVAAGADGGVCGGANLRPQLFVDLYRASREQDQQQIDSLQRQVLELAREYYGSPIRCESVIGGLKRGLANQHVCREEMAPPFIASTRSNAEAVQAEKQR